MGTLPNDPTDLTAPDRIMAGLAKIALVMRHEAWRASGERGLTPTQSQILAVINGNTEPVGIKEVARQLAVGMGTASEAVSALAAKGLVEKTPSEDDGRAVVLALTGRGRRQAAAAAEWPEGMLDAIASLPEREQAGLLRGLVGMVRSLQESGRVPTARMCVGCRFFRPNEYPGLARAHHCLFIGAPIGDADLRLDCTEMEPTDRGAAPRLWSVFLNGEALDPDGPGRRRSPSKSRQTTQALDQGVSS